MAPPIPIVDSHIHLFPESHLPTLAWYTPNDPGPLGAQHSVEQYREATKDISMTSSEPSETAKKTYLRGFIFVETDRLSSITESTEVGNHGWSHALDEVSFLARVAAGNPVQGEGHNTAHSQFCLGIVPWAPVPGGPEALEKYIALVRERATNEEIWSKIRGVRYLVQDKPAGVMLEPAFIEGLKWLGRKGLAFDLGVDARQGGIWQLEEAVEMLRRTFEGVDEKEKVVIVINHLCKPNLRLEQTSPESITTHPDFLQWKAQVMAMAQFSAAYMKFSGSFSELPPLSPDSEPVIASLVERLQPWTDAIFDAFGPERVMFGSDWPVCNVGGGGNKVTWSRWNRVVEGILERRGVDDEQRKEFWGGVAVKAYGVTI
ncbi:amidohydrolase family protein [Aspergillus crustosus]